ncbi:radical SAM family heme chaperone HemW [Mariniblastus sp.]|nr:radical SAM family heme chaperone HemW [Mariniblastus sp.]
MTVPRDTFRPALSLPRSVYVHVPFCRHRCGYCNFSVVAGRDYLVERYLNAIETEIGWLEKSYEIDTLFLGGGTPSHLSPANLERLMVSIRSRFSLADDAEVTAECNPNDLDASTATALAACGVNRISLGVQSLDAAKLKSLERDHTLEDVHRAVERARLFASSVSVDLIFAAPGETLEEWQRDLEAALQLQTDHVSAYELTYEKGTQFWNRLNAKSITEADEDTRADMYNHAISRLNDAGLAQYEISSFAKAGHRCRHNEVYWNGQPYFAFGPSAARFVDGVREMNHLSTMKYFKHVEAGERPIDFHEQLSPEAAARERLSIALRHVDGVDCKNFERETGFSITQLLGENGPSWQQQGLMTLDDRVRLTAAGRMIYNHITTQIERVLS